MAFLLFSKLDKNIDSWCQYQSVRLLNQQLEWIQNQIKAIITHYKHKHFYKIFEIRAGSFGV